MGSTSLKMKVALGVPLLLAPILTVCAILAGVKSISVLTLVPVLLFAAVAVLFQARALDRQLSISDQQQAALGEQSHLSQLLIDTVPNPVFYKDSTGRYLGCNRAFEQAFQVSRQELLGKSAYEIVPLEPGEVRALADGEPLASGELQVREASVRYGDGTLHEVLFYNSPFTRGDGEPGGMVGTFLDVSDRKRMENALHHAQKMEAVGQLAGGVAHDFNNILTAIVGFTSILEMQLSGESRLSSCIEQIKHAAERGSRLTQGLLAFSRKQASNRVPVDLNEIVGRAERVLRQMAGKKIELQTRLSERELLLNADGIQVEQVIMNLATNAMDAMAGGGVLTVETARLTVDREFSTLHGYGGPGEYGVLTVADSGSGMDAATQKRIFEPFFTTKEVGQGSGLGLAIVYGVVKRHQGYLNCDSEQGKGSRFRIYFPLVKAEPASPREPAFHAPVRGSETAVAGDEEATAGIREERDR